MFTKQHYEVIADIVGESYDKKDVIFKMCKYFKFDNPKFDRMKFINRCNKTEK